MEGLTLPEIWATKRLAKILGADSDGAGMQNPLWIRDLRELRRGDDVGEVFRKWTASGCRSPIPDWNWEWRAREFPYEGGFQWSWSRVLVPPADAAEFEDFYYHKDPPFEVGLWINSSNELLWQVGIRFFAIHTKGYHEKGPTRAFMEELRLALKESEPRPTRREYTKNSLLSQTVSRDRFAVDISCGTDDMFHPAGDEDEQLGFLERTVCATAIQTMRQVCWVFEHNEVVKQRFLEHARNYRSPYSG